MSEEQIPAWRQKQLQIEQKAKDKAEQERLERLRKIEEIKKRHLSAVSPSAGAGRGVRRTQSIGGAPMTNLAKKQEAKLTASSVDDSSVPKPVTKITDVKKSEHQIPSPEQQVPKTPEKNPVQSSEPNQSESPVQNPNPEQSAKPEVILYSPENPEIKKTRHTMLNRTQTMTGRLQQGSKLPIGKSKTKPDPTTEETKLKEMEEELNRIRQMKDDLQNKHTASVSELQSTIFHEKTKQESMEEELARIRRMKDEIEREHLEYRKRLEKKIEEERIKKLEVEEELNRTRQRLVKELEEIKNTKDILSAEIDSLKGESEKKKQLETELEVLKGTKDKLDAEIEVLKAESERRKQIENELEQINKTKDKLHSEILTLKAEQTKKETLEKELENVRNTSDKLSSEIEGLKTESERRKQIESELEEIRKAKETLTVEIESLKEESEQKRKLEEELEKLKGSRENLHSEIEKLKLESERRQKIENELVQLKILKEGLSSEIDFLKSESEKKKHLEDELNSVKNTKDKLTAEIERLRNESEKHKIIESELDQIRQMKEKLTHEIESLKEEGTKRLRLEAELVEVKGIKERLAAEITTLKQQLENSPTEDEEDKNIQEESRIAQEEARLAEEEAKKAKEEALKLESKVLMQQRQIDKLKEKNKKLSMKTLMEPTKKPGGLSFSLNLVPKTQEKDLFYKRLGDVKFKKAFVTGGSGFIGGELIKTLVANGITVVALCRSDENEATVKNLGAVAARGSLDLDYTQELSTLMKGCEIVFHLAAISDNEKHEWEEFERVNINGTESVCNAARLANVKRLVFCSSAAVIINEASQRFAVDETLTIHPDNITPYFAKSKALAERIVLKYGRSRNTVIEAVVIRPPWVWGRGDKKFQTIVEAIKNNTFSWVNGGNYLYSSCYVANVVEALVFAALEGETGETYFVADAYPMQFKDFITRMLATQNIDCSHIGSVSSWLGNAVSWLQKFSGYSLNYDTTSFSTLTTQSILVSDKKARSKLGYTGMITFEQGLDELREQYIENLKTPRLASVVHYV